MKHYIVSGIEWNTDGEDIPLPVTVNITVQDDEDVIDVLSDKYEFCIKSVQTIKEL